MSRVRVPGPRDGPSGRLQLSGVLILSGLGVQVATFLWNHPVSFFLFLVPGTVLVGAGMLLYVSFLMTGTGNRSLPGAR